MCNRIFKIFSFFDPLHARCLSHLSIEERKRAIERALGLKVGGYDSLFFPGIGVLAGLLALLLLSPVTSAIGVNGFPFDLAILPILLLFVLLVVCLLIRVFLFSKLTKERGKGPRRM